MPLRAYFYDRSGNAINDPENTAERAENISLDTNWPGGFGGCSLILKRDPTAWWPVKLAHEVIIRDGGRIVFQGELIPRSEIGEKFLQTAISAKGFYYLLSKRRIRKRWVDNAPVTRMIWPAARQTTETQQNMDANKRDNMILIRGGYGDVNKNNGDSYYEEYRMPTNNPIRKITSSYAIRTGEGIKAEWWNDDNAASEVSVTDSSGAQVTGSLNTADPLAQGDTELVTLRITLTASDIYDENDRCEIYDITIYGQYESTHGDYASPSYTNGEIVEDVLILAGSGISEDYDDIADPGITLTGFVTEADGFETADRIIERLAAYGDASQNTWGLAVWDETGTSDGKPKAVFEARSISDYEYRVRLADLQDFSHEPTLDELWNNIIISYIDANDQRQFLTGDDDATLTDSDSISDYGERHSPVIDIGKAESSTAQDIGQRVLAYHKDPLYKTSFSIASTIENKQGIPIPVSWVRAGERVKILDYNGGTIYFVRHTQYNDDSKTIAIMPDLPPDTLDIFLAQREQ